MLKVLIVDDEEDFRDPIACFLTRSGYETRTAASGEEAQRISETFSPDLLVTDWRLEGKLNGAVLAASLEQSYPKMQTIVISGYCAADIEDALNGKSVFAVIEKPLDLHTLHAKVLEALAAKE